MATQAQKRKVALLTTTAIAPAIDTPTPGKGDNSGVAGYVLPLPQDTHRDIETTLTFIMENEKAVDFARQKLAHLLMDRHAQLVAIKPAGSVPFAHDLAINNDAYAKYLDELVNEFTLADPDKVKQLTLEARETVAKRVRRRLNLALQLFVNIAWYKVQNPNDVCAWDAEAMRWAIYPGAFVPPGFQAGGDLLMEKDKRTPRMSVLMETAEGDPPAYYFVSKAKGAGVNVNVSLDQFNYVIQQSIRVLQSPHQDTNGIEATPGRARRGRAVRPPGTPAPATPATGETPATDDTSTAQSDAGKNRTYYIEQFVKALVQAEKWLEHDELADLRWSELPKEGYNAMQTMDQQIDRMNALSDGKPAKPAKPATKPTAKAA